MLRLMTLVSGLFLGLLACGLVGCSHDVELVEQKCTTCHGLEGDYSRDRTESEWSRVVVSMKAMGLKVTDSEEERLVQALSKEYGK